MNELLYANLQNLKKEYDAYLEDINKRQSSYVEGSLRIQRTSPTNVVFYQRIKGKDYYIPKINKALISALLQKRYDRIVRPILLNEIKCISTLLKKTTPNSFDSAFDRINKDCQNLIDPINKPFESFVVDWQSSVSKTNSIPVDQNKFVTDNNETVRSKSELIIANTLKRYNIPYKYECSYTCLSQTYYPDFTILCKKSRKTVYWEHCGKMGSPEYRSHLFKKLYDYSKSGLCTGNNLILTFEDDSNPLSTLEIQNIVSKIAEL